MLITLRRWREGTSGSRSGRLSTPPTCRLPGASSHNHRQQGAKLPLLLSSPWCCAPRLSSVVASAMYCSFCGRTFASEEALEQHTQAKHGDHAAAAQPKRRRRRLSAETFDPSIDDPGHWVEREDFPGRKIFGAFVCHSCSKVWVSAHAFTAFKQVRAAGCGRSVRQAGLGDLPRWHVP
jgi:hypothetical protein